MAIGLWLLRRTRRPRGPGLARAAPILVLAGLVLGVLVVGPITLVVYSVNENRVFLRKLARGDVAVVEGPVADFVPQDSTGHPEEQFRVGTHHYAYSPSSLQPGYHTPRWQGGVIGPGMYVRIAEIDSHIGRIEVRQ